MMSTQRYSARESIVKSIALYCLIQTFIVNSPERAEKYYLKDHLIHSILNTDVRKILIRLQIHSLPNGTPQSLILLKHT